jgi:hypothetical protein
VPVLDLEAGAVYEDGAVLALRTTIVAAYPENVVPPQPMPQITQLADTGLLQSE